MPVLCACLPMLLFVVREHNGMSQRTFFNNTNAMLLLNAHHAVPYSGWCCCCCCCIIDLYWCDAKPCSPRVICSLLSNCERHHAPSHCPLAGTQSQSRSHSYIKEKEKKTKKISVCFCALKSNIGVCVSLSSIFGAFLYAITVAAVIVTDLSFSL